MNDRWTDRLSEYLDGELDEGERIALESHLQSCYECSAILADLRRVVQRARAPRDQTPPRDLWPGIAGRIGASAAGSPAIVDLTARRHRARRWSFSLPQLAAAGLALMTLSGGAVWLVGSRSRPDASPATVVVAGNEAASVPVAMRPSASQSYAAAVADLERVLEQGRGKLDTTTIRVIEQNLAAIDRAIAEAQRALEFDSANLYLNTHLAETMRPKLDLLRQAAALVPVS